MLFCASRRESTAFSEKREAILLSFYAALTPQSKIYAELKAEYPEFEEPTHGWVYCFLILGTN